MDDASVIEDGGPTSLGSSPSDDLLRALADTGGGDVERLVPGARLGRFRIEAILGRGGMGVVYAARDEELERDVAIKVLHERHVARAERRRRFLREAKAAAAVSHPNVAHILEVGEGPEGVYLVFEKVVGLTLRAHTRAKAPEGTLPFVEILEIGRAIARGLAAAHDAGIVHRDLKPDNVLVGAAGEIKILDFGLAKWSGPRATTEANDDDHVPSVLTVEGDILGSPGYMSPEQALGQPTSLPTDVFSLGVVLFELATGERPFTGSTPMETIVATTRDAAPDPCDARRSRPALPRAFGQLVQACLSKAPSGRPDVRAVEQGLARCLAERGTLAPERRLALVSGMVLAVGGAAALLVTVPPSPSRARSATADVALIGSAIAPSATSAVPVEMAPRPPISSAPLSFGAGTSEASPSLPAERRSVVEPPRAPTSAPRRTQATGAAVTAPPRAPLASSTSDPSFSERK